LLQFIWQFQYFNLSDLRLVSGEPLQIIAPGQFNTNQGPDFLEAKIRIGQTTWAGNIELHLEEGDWLKHAHHDDPNFQNVILHVIWNQAANSTGLPTLDLSDRVSKFLLHRYEELMFGSGIVPCSHSLNNVPSIIWQGWKERLVAERLERKSKMITSYLEQSNDHWEEVFWWMIARNFGMKVNAEAFEAIARSIPVNLLSKHKSQVIQLECFLFGQAGLLSGQFKEDYPIMLKKEYQFYKKKYGLKPINHPIHLLRMRPGNFPTIRLAQLAMLIHHSLHLFSTIKEVNDIDEIRNSFQVTANDYWHYHYLFDETAAFQEKRLGEDMVNNIIINTIVPVLFAYGHHHQVNHFKIKAIHWLENISAEKNAITKNWESLGIPNKNAWDSQALIELKQQFCDVKRCLECAIGNQLLKVNLRN
jgi:Protein of unknown function (DUF2851)